ncbi:MAG: VacJ family lipoprotein [Deltaproteobacteria bacterium]|nr:VacJ family lipoprotein [Deltaproteobacteria bacterium]MBW1921915.1 VacJ family lipoprotein [Deltaproteobacteria bacterium]MBW1948817.1 VacJ family lipoprotein [Deltaproteobacteria bacterium]MBW2008757.1 VacJ family lipoprotein [Deltaproteobacteria bacterium]MBW2102732.1 VacJ family lipoprotein [Deltaproteobacteria bacterium]
MTCPEANSHPAGRKVYSLTLLLFVGLFMMGPGSAGALPHEEEGVHGLTISVPPSYVEEEEISAGGSAVLLAEAATREKIRPDEFEDLEDEEPLDALPDPLEPVNRVFFEFNDRLYFWVLKPVAQGYRFVVPQLLRVSIRNFFTNLKTPIRAVNCLLQGKIEGFGWEILRFVVNSTAGFGGLQDVAKIVWDKGPQDEDLGQTLGLLGIGPGFYICWPFLGPSSLRDTVGFAGDSFLDPLNYVIPSTRDKIAVKGYEKGVNRVSLEIGEYESMKKAALDPYVAMRDAYHQHRKAKIKK